MSIKKNFLLMDYKKLSILKRLYNFIVSEFQLNRRMILVLYLCKTIDSSKLVGKMTTQ